MTVLEKLADKESLAKLLSNHPHPERFLASPKPRAPRCSDQIFTSLEVAINFQLDMTKKGLHFHIIKTCAKCGRIHVIGGR
jgi:hypothetical protein